MYPSFLTVFFFNDFYVLFHAAEFLPKFLEHPYNHYFEPNIWLASISLVIFLGISFVLSFEICFFVSTFWQLSYV